MSENLISSEKKIGQIRPKYYSENWRQCGRGRLTRITEQLMNKKKPQGSSPLVISTW